MWHKKLKKKQILTFINICKNDTFKNIIMAKTAQENKRANGKALKPNV